ncbi:MAG: DNA polymerase III subunit delta [Clostridia bacterium]|nr:DNA polymerase III subunit delta [Clostridia bacterium]
MAGSIKKDIREGAKNKVYLVWGDEEFLRDYYKTALVDKVLDKDFADFNFKQYTTKKPDNDEIESFFSSYPCMSDKKIVYIKDSGIFKKVSEDDKKFWQKFLTELPDFAIIIFSEKSVDKRNALYKLINSEFCCDEFPFQKRPDLISWIIRYFAKYEKNITDSDAEYLIECCSESMYILKSEIEKLANYKSKAKNITKDDIDKCSCKIPESRVFKMIDDILDGNIKGAGEKLAELKLLKEEPIALTAAVFSKYSQLRKEKLLSKTMSPREIAIKTGQKDYFVNIHLKQIKNTTLQKLDDILKCCQSLDYKVKSGLSDSWTEFEILFAKMCG